MTGAAGEAADARGAEFLGVLAGVLEVASVSPADDYRKTPLWGSLTAFALKVTLAQRYGRDFSMEELKSFASVGELMRRALG